MGKKMFKLYLQCKKKFFLDWNKKLKHFLQKKIYARKRESMQEDWGKSVSTCRRENSRTSQYFVNWTSVDAYNNEEIKMLKWRNKIMMI